MKAGISLLMLAIFIFFIECNEMSSSMLNNTSKTSPVEFQVISRSEFESIPKEYFADSKILRSWMSSNSQITSGKEITDNFYFRYPRVQNIIVNLALNTTSDMCDDEYAIIFINSTVAENILKNIDKEDVSPESTTMRDLLGKIISNNYICAMRYSKKNGWFNWNEVVKAKAKFRSRIQSGEMDE